MGVRNFMRRRQSVTAALACLAILLSGAWIWYYARNMRPSGPGKAFFSIDDGQTVFVDDAIKLAPFDKDGKPAYRAHVFECGGERVVGYLSRYTPEALAALEEAKSYRGKGEPPPNVRQLASIGTTGVEVKRPGDAKWVSQTDAARATKIRVFTCPDGSTPKEAEP